ncbi:MAG: HigA family addiction module antitoxin, partial [Methyloceanibacter sp.]
MAGFWSLTVSGNWRLIFRFEEGDAFEVDLVDYIDETRNMPMKTPPHVGGLIRREIIEPMGLSVTQAAAVLGVTRQALSNLLNARTALTPDMALRIEKAFGPKMDHLMRMQLAYDIADARLREAQ